jgi:hypothetical protein
LYLLWEMSSSTFSMAIGRNDILEEREEVRKIQPSPWLLHLGLSPPNQAPLAVSIVVIGRTPRTVARCSSYDNNTHCQGRLVRWGETKMEEPRRGLYQPSPWLLHLGLSPPNQAPLAVSIVVIGRTPRNRPRWRSHGEGCISCGKCRLVRFPWL